MCTTCCGVQTSDVTQPSHLCVLLDAEIIDTVSDPLGQPKRRNVNDNSLGHLDSVPGGSKFLNENAYIYTPLKNKQKRFVLGLVKACNRQS